MAAKLWRFVLAQNGLVLKRFLADSSHVKCSGRLVQGLENRSSRKNACCKRFFTSAVSSSEETQPSPRVLTAVCLERLPQITPNKTELEERFELLQEQLELEHSVFSDEEIELKKLNQRKKKVSDDDDEGIMEIAKVEAERKEFDEEEEEEQRRFRPADRETDADKNNDVRSMDRKLYDTLVLVVKTKGGWELPVGEISEGETLRQAAEKKLSSSCGSNLVARFLTNAPLAVIRDLQGLSSHKDKVFIYKAQYVSGNLVLGDEFRDHAWVTRDELKDYINPEFSRLLAKIVY